MFLIKFLLVDLSRRLTGELIAYIRKASGAHPLFVCLSILSNNFSEVFWQLFQICHRSITGLGGEGSDLHVVYFILIGEELGYNIVEVENSKFSSVNGDFYGIQLTLVWPHIIIT